MCGITGVFHFEGQQTVDRLSLKKMSDLLAHRGPDGEGFFLKNNVGLAHRRLSIIDLSSGAQPMYSDDRSVVIVFNGEIYNYIEVQQELTTLGHKFKTTSDTEVIIRAYEQWGIDCQSRFNGMWSFALWDDRKQHLFISRDRMGEKPLYYGVFNNTFLFGSEIKSIKAYGTDLKPDPDLLELYLFLGYIPEPYSFYKGVQKLKAGHYLIVSENQVRDFAYWDLPGVDEKAMLTDQKQIVETFAGLFTDSVKIRMRSDVAYGAFLSGGLDSSAIVAEMSRISSKPIETFTIGFNEKQFDERDKANIVAGHFKTNHHEHVADLDTFDGSLKNILFHYDEPFADPAAIPVELVSRYAAKQVKMVLTGDGADEVLAGYSSYQSESMAGKYHRLPAFIRQGLPVLIDRSALVLTGGIRYKANRVSRVLHNYNTTFQNRLISKLIKVPASAMKSLYSGAAPLMIEDFVHDTLLHCPFKDPFNQLMYYQLKVSLPGQMLVKVDRMSMARSLETRAPFLDHRIVEYMYGVDKKIKMPDKGAVKNVLKQAMKNKLPGAIIHRTKKGFDVPLREWFKDNTFDKRLNQDFQQYGLNGTQIRQIINENKTGKADHGTLIWRLLVYAGWMKQF